jgi:membrane associated rhomboid family serine protease
MDLKKIFKRLILIDLLLFSSSLILVMFFESNMSAKAYQILHMNDSKIESLIVGASSILIVVFFYVTLVFLYKFFRLGRIFFTIYFTLTIIYLLFSGTIVEDSYINTVDSLQTALDGAILALLYLSPISKEFQKKIISKTKR